MLVTVIMISFKPEKSYSAVATFVNFKTPVFSSISRLELEGFVSVN